MAQPFLPGLGPGLGSRLAGFLGNPLLEQIFVWQVLQQISSAVLAPEVAGIQEEIFKLNPSVALSPAEAADAANRAHMDPAAAAEEAKLSGLNGERFKVLLEGAGEALPLQSLLEAWRRQIIDKAGSGAASVSLEQGIRESRLHNKWIPVIEALQFLVPSPGLVIEGWLRAQIDKEQALKYLYQSGIDEAHATLWYNSSGRPLSPQEAAEAFHRGLLPEHGTGPGAISLDQVFLETDLKNKYLEVWKGIQTYLPPPRTITALIREGALSDAQGLTYFKANGLPAELAAVYVAAAHHQKVAADKELAKADVLRLYAAKQMTAAQAEAALTLLGWSPANIAFLLGYEDFKAEIHLVDQALARLRSLYLGHKISKGTAAAAIDSLGLDSAARDNLLKFWDVDRNATPVLLTPTELAQGAALGLLDAGDTFDELQGRGFDARDAYIFLATHKVDLTSVAKPAGVRGA